MKLNNNGWQVKSLGEVLDSLESGGRPKGGGLTIGDIPSLGAEHLNDQGRFNYDSMKYIPKDYFNSMQRGIVNINDILVVKDGATTGKVSLVKNDFPFEQAAINEHLFLVRTNKEILDPLFAFYFLYSSVGNLQIMTDFRGSAQGGISREFVNKVSIPLPPLPIQKQIAEILEKADEAKQKRKEANKLTDEFLQSVFIEMFGDPVKNPKRWDKKTLTEIISSERNSLKRGPFGSTLRKDIFVKSGYLVYEQYHALNNDFTFQRYFIDEEKYKELKMFSVRDGDLIVSCSGVYLGKIAIVPNGSPAGIINQALLKITLDKRKVSNIYFIYLWQTHLIQKILSLVSRGSGIPNFPSMSEIKQILFPVPSLSLQQQFAEIVNKTEALKEKQKQSEQELEHLFQSLMQKAFKGELV